MTVCRPREKKREEREKAETVAADIDEQQVEAGRERKRREGAEQKNPLKPSTRARM